MAKKGGGGNQDGQRVMFVSLFMIMLAFFILLNSIAVITEERTKEAIKSIGGAFGHLSGGLSLYDSQQGNPQPSSPIKAGDSQDQFLTKLQAKFTGKLGSGVEVTPAPGGKGALIRISAPDNFQGTSTDLPPDLAERLKEVAELAQEADAGVVVRGHTALRPGSDRAEAWWISGRRAQKVLKIFHGQGVDVKRLRMAGFGDEQPLGGEAIGEPQRNERVEVTLKLNGEADPAPLYPGRELAPAITGDGGGGG